VKRTPSHATDGPVDPLRRGDQRVMEKRGRLHVYERLEPAKTALLVVDVQGYYRDLVPDLATVSENINVLASRLRSRGGLVVWVQNTMGANGVSTWPEYHERFFSQAKAREHMTRLGRGHPDHALLSELKTASEDARLEKFRFSPFAPGASDLEPLLAERGIENIIIAGVATNVCCESTARDAMMRNYRVLVVSDATAALTKEDHFTSLVSLSSCFADIRTTEEVARDVLG